MKNDNKKTSQTSELPQDVQDTSGETPIEVPNNPADNPLEESIAKDSLPAEELVEERSEAIAQEPVAEGEAAVSQDQIIEEKEAQTETPETQDDQDLASTDEEELNPITKPSGDETPLSMDQNNVESQDEEEIKEDEPEVAEEVTEKEKDQDKQTMESSTKDNPNAKWYIVHTYSGHENKVAKSLKQRIQSLGFEDRIFDIIVPMRNTIKVSQGKKESVKEKIFPGYVLVRMVLDDESWLLVRTTQGVTAFIGAGNKPTPISEKEVEAIQKFMNADEPLYKTAFSVGEAVKITDGPFNDFLGTIDAIDEARGKLKVLVSIFGRETPVELDFLQVKKL